MQQGWHARLIAAAAASSLLSTPATAQDFYAGKTVDFIVGHYVGGGYDIYARALARHYSRHIPGHPAIVVRNMPGAGSAKAGLHIANTAARDGTVIGAVTPGAIMAALLDGRNDTTFDPTRVAFIGTANHGTRICVTMKEAAAQTFADMLKTKTVIGGVAVNDATHDYAYMVKNVTGAQLSIVAGYNGTANIGLAMERREVDGSCGWDWASFKSQRARWLKENRVNVLAQIGQDPDEDLTRRGALPIWNFISNEDDRKAVELIVSQQVFHRSYIAPPGVPAPRLAILRTAFLATMKDPQFLADADKTGIDIAPLDGGKIQELIARLAATPDAVVQRAKRAIRP
jgi:tripartite-type tricarboxylate transporter receptor subunit TctC